MDTMNDILHPRESDAVDPNFPHAPQGWSREAAAQAAGSEGLKTSTDHWEAVRALQDYFARNAESGINARELHDALDEKFHARGGIKYLYKLFPRGPVAQGCRIAGLEPPAGSEDASFGSVMQAADLPVGAGHGVIADRCKWPGVPDSGTRVREIITLATDRRETLVDITDPVKGMVTRSGIAEGMVMVYAQGATAAIMIQENWDESVQTDVINFLRGIIPRGVWLHDAQDGNGDAHLKAGLVGPSETIPLIGGQLGLSTWQNIFLCEFDGPRRERRVVVTVISDS